MLSHKEERNMTVQDGWGINRVTEPITVLGLRAAGGHDWDWVENTFVPRSCGNRECKTCGVKK